MEELKYISPKEITANPYQPRLHFDQEKLEELAQSIKQNGLIQPIIVRPSAVIGYELLAGERRLRACQLAGLEKIPVIIKELSDDELLYQSIIENLQRADLNPIEEAKSYKKLLHKGLTHEEIASIMGKSRPYISNILRLLQLSSTIQDAIEHQQLSQGHARLLVPLSEQEQAAWLEKIQKEEMSVRKLEKELAGTSRVKCIKKKNLFLTDEEKKLSQLLGTDVSIHQKQSGQGSITISFRDTEEYERIIHNLQ